MSNDAVPTPSSSWLSGVNLPEILGGPAGKAIARLVAGAADIPAAYLEQVAQGIRDKTEAKQVVSRSIAGAAAKLAVSDPKIVERATHSLLAKEVRHQQNREAVARKTLEVLEEDSFDQAKEELSDDWLNVFERYAGDASSEWLQYMWARVLAGEIRKPNTFSLQTLRFVAEMDQHIAATFEKWSPAVVGSQFIPSVQEGMSGVTLRELLELQEYGLLTGVGGALKSTLAISASGKTLVDYKRKHAVELLGTPGTKFSIPGAVLTTIGKQIYGILQPAWEIEHAKRLAELLEKQHLVRISAGSLRETTSGQFELVNPIVLWTKSSP